MYTVYKLCIAVLMISTIYIENDHLLNDAIIHDFILYIFLYLRKYITTLYFKKNLLEKYSIM